MLYQHAELAHKLGVPFENIFILANGDIFEISKGSARVTGFTNGDAVLIDGNRIPPGITVPVRAVVKGDSLSASIAAASILAKVSRDRYMKQMAEKYPQYGFEKHKGYGTKAHYAAVDEFGLCEIHRKSFFKKYFEKKESHG